MSFYLWLISVFWRWLWRDGSAVKNKAWTFGCFIVIVFRTVLIDCAFYHRASLRAAQMFYFWPRTFFKLLPQDLIIKIIFHVLPRLLLWDGRHNVLVIATLFVCLVHEFVVVHVVDDDVLLVDFVVLLGLVLLNHFKHHILLFLLQWWVSQQRWSVIKTCFVHQHQILLRL